MVHRPTRWELADGGQRGYGRRFGDLVAAGSDVDGEARLADALAPRAARILDVGSGMGRVAAALSERGHHVTAVEPDPDLVAQSRSTYPGLPVVPADILDADPAQLDPSGAGFDLAVLVGNVIVLVAEGTESEVLRRIRDLLAPSGRLLVGYHPVDGPSMARDYAPEEFLADAREAGLKVDLHAGSYELHPPAGDYDVWVLTRDSE